MTTDTKKPRLRFAPSPTGYLHVGGARTALFNWLFAKHSGGTFVLRIEDTDTKRSTEAAVDAIFEGLRYLGIDYDEGPGKEVGEEKYFQTQRLELYHKYALELFKKGMAYPCFKTEEELEPLKKAAEAKGLIGFQREWEQYTSRELRKFRKEKRPYSIRFASPKEGEIVVNDIVLGEVKFQVKDTVDDLVLIKKNGVPTYNFACVIDDALMGITHVLRGDDHLSNTPKQVAIYQALGLPMPQFGHIPMILGPDKKKLSKRHAATSVTDYRDKGYLPHALLNYLVRLGWSHGDQEIFSLDEMIQFFDLTSLNKTAAVFDEEKLNWVNAHYMQNTTAKDLLASTGLMQMLSLELGPDVPVGKIIKERGAEWFINLIEVQKNRSTTLAHLINQSRYFFEAAIKYDEAAVAKHLTAQSKAHLVHLNNLFQQEETWTEASIEALITKYCNDRQIKVGVVAQPLRVAATGTAVSPPIFTTLALLGKKLTTERLKAAIELQVAAP